ncbi:MIP/aquaporin family protein [Nocardioides sp. R-C-SC26]|uniref:MIP/aquaporin family protein n=1 Tax=Nocardioides sp. R-C-SC26 TaxID=2870414 RepID=UPI001E3854AD|nr:aquaporin [Nocardioides sp. R-C-SC26]
MNSTSNAASPAPAPTTAQKLGAEAIGTFVLVVVGVGAATIGGGDVASIGLAFGIAIVAMVYAFGRVSGGHFNPAVSVGAALSGRISWREAGLYSLAQIGGGLVGGLVIALIAVSSDIGYELGDPIGANGFGDFGGAALLGALLIEVVLTFVFLTVILAVTDERNEHPALAPLAIGLTLAAIHFASIGATGTSVNPARSIGVAFFSGTDAIVQLWVFIVAPLLGAAIAGLLYPAIFGRHSDPVPGSGLSFGSGARPGAVPGYGAPDQFQQQWNQPHVGQFGQPAQPGYPAQQMPHQVAQPAPQQSHPTPAPAPAPAPTPSAAQPIIQDGWMWDAAAQQWVPAPAPTHPGEWVDPNAERTQIRPTDGT